MLGCLQDAEEVAQETFTRAWQRLGDVRSSEASRAWLYKTATNACIDMLRARRRRTLPHLCAPIESTAHLAGPLLHEELWLEPAPDFLVDAEDDAERPDARLLGRESISLAFIAALQLLPAKQRAALLLIDVVGLKPGETARLLETTVLSVNSLLQRARRTVEHHAAKDSSIAEGRAADDEELLRRYIVTWESGDLDAFIALVAEDAVLSMPPQPEWYVGRDAIRTFLERLFAGESRQYRLVPIAANGRRAVAVYHRRRLGEDAFEAAAIKLLTMRRSHVTEMIRFGSPRLFPLFGLPSRIQGVDVASTFA
jgi:RNA polymerase sigma-70 factor (ECF subfamily)